MIEKILKKIDEYECICLYRHVNPDYDAFGSQFGMYDLIQNTFENKEVYFAGDFSSDLVAKYQFNGEINEPNFDSHTLPFRSQIPAMVLSWLHEIGPVPVATLAILPLS